MAGTDAPLWFDDGNVILRSGDTMHRVHRSVMAKYSAFFQRVFDVRKCLDGDSENPPVLNVTECDKSLSHYVRARYNDDRQYFEDWMQPFHITIHLLAASREFSDSRMRDHVVSRLMVEYPSTLMGWDRIQHSRSACRIELADAMDIDALNALQLHHVYSAIPIVFYKICVHYSIEIICRGISREDGSVAKLSQDDQISCAIGRERLKADQFKYTYKWIGDGSLPLQECAHRDNCIKQLRFIDNAVRGATLRIRALDQWCTGWDGKLCFVCERWAKQNMQYGRNKIWKTLPSIFGHGNWESLGDAEAEWKLKEAEFNFRGED